MNNTVSQHWASDEEKLEAFVLHRIDKEEFSNLTAHLEKCDDCRKRVQEERELQIGIHKFGHREMKRRLKLRLRRDRSRRFEWIQVASIAAAIVVVFSAVLTVRWFFDIKKEKTRLREIVFQESKPAERAIWIIGKVIEIKETSGSLARSRTNTTLIADNRLETRDNIRSEADVSQKLMAESNAERGKDETSIVKEGQAISSEGKTDLHDAENSRTKEAPALSATNEIESRPDVSSNTLKSAAPMAKKMSDSRDSLGFEAKGGVTLATEDKLVSRIGYSSREERASVPTTERKQKTNKTVPAKAKTGLVMIAKRTRKNKKASTVLVCRGDMNDLPASMRDGDVSVIHTRLERTPKGVLLTFYSSTITDSVATNIETITPDSIIVTFRNRQISYHIPEGWAGGM